MIARVLSSCLDEDDAAPPGGAAPLASPSAARQQQWLQVVTEVKKLKILIVTLPESGHLNPVLNLGALLAQRGHKVTLATCAFFQPKVSRQCAEAGIEFLGLAPDMASPDTAGSPAQRFKKGGAVLLLYDLYNKAMHPSLSAALDKSRPDVIVADFMTHCAFVAGEDHRTPVAVNFADPVILNIAGHSPSPLFALSFCVLAPLAFGGGLRCGPAAAKIIGHIFDSIWRRLCLVNSFWGMQEVGCMPPNVVFIGPTGPRPEGEARETSLPPPLSEWVEWVRAEKLRIVYVTFGSMLELGAAQVRSLYDGLAALPGVAVAWSLKEASQKHLPADLPKRFFVYHWFPQAEFLRIREVQAVITHCGWGGMMEIVMAGKPIVGVPFQGDQPENARTAKRHGFGEVVLPGQLTATAVKRAVGTVLEGPGYARNAKKMQAALLTSGGAPHGVLHVESLAMYDAKHYVRRPPTLLEDVGKKMLGVLVVSGACLAIADHMRRIFRPKGP